MVRFLNTALEADDYNRILIYNSGPLVTIDLSFYNKNYQPISFTEALEKNAINYNFYLISNEIITFLEICSIDTYLINKYKIDQNILALIILYNIGQVFGEFYLNPEMSRFNFSKYQNRNKMIKEFATKFVLTFGYNNARIDKMNKLLKRICDTYDRDEHIDSYNDPYNGY